MKDHELLLKHALKVRNQGRIRYSLKSGFFFGIMSFLVNTLVKLNEQSFMELVFSWRGLLFLTINILFWVILHGSFFWWLNERTIKKVIEIEKHKG